MYVTYTVSILLSHLRLSFRGSSLSSWLSHQNPVCIPRLCSIMYCDNWITGAEPFLWSRPFCSYSRTSQQFMEPESSLPCSQEPSTGPYSEPDRLIPYHLIMITEYNTYLNEKFWEELVAYFPLIRHGSHTKRAKQFFYFWVCIRCYGNALTDPLPSNGKCGYTYRHTDWWEGFMKHTVKMGPGAIIYIPRFIQIGSDI
jgi:hypothetical protein